MIISLLEHKTLGEEKVIIIRFSFIKIMVLFHFLNICDVQIYSRMMTVTTTSVYNCTNFMHRYNETRNKTTIINYMNSKKIVSLK